MLFLTRTVWQVVVVGDDLEVRLLGADGLRARLAFELSAGGVLLCRGFNAGGDFCVSMELGDRFEFAHRSFLHIRSIGHNRAVFAFRVPEHVSVNREEELRAETQAVRHTRQF